MPRTLLSVSDKSGLVDLASGLQSRGFELVSTGGTARALAEAGLAVTNVSDITKFPEMMDGRVKTLHPLVHGGILARRAHAEDLEAARAHGIGLIDLVVVNLYPFVKTAARADVAFDDLIEQIDIGGPSMVRAAAKNFRDVLVVVDPADYPQVLAALDAPGGASAAFRFDLARKAFGHTAAYDAAIAGTLGTIESRGGDFVRPAPGADVLPPRFVLDLPKVRDLRYGENPHQKAAWYANGGEGFGAVQILQGKELSFTNLLDLDSAARIVLEFSEPAATVIKHTNPCGAATGTSGRRLRPGEGSRSARRLRWHRRVEPPDRRGDRAGHHVHVHRGRHRAQRPRGRAAHPGEEVKHARGRGGLRGPCGGRCARTAVHSRGRARAAARRGCRGPSRVARNRSG